MNSLNLDETTMTPEEAESIVRRLADRSAPTGGPKVGELAEALGVSPEEVARVLAEVRSTPLARPKRRIARRERRVWLLSGLLALGLAGIAFGAMQALRFGPAFRPTDAGTTTVGADTMAVGPVYWSPVRASVAVAAKAAPAEGSFRVFLDGQDMNGEIHADDVPSKSLPDALEAWLKENAERFQPPSTPTTTEEAARSREAAAQGRWGDVAGVQIQTVELRRPNDSGKAMRWAWAKVPIYGGDDALVADAVRAARRRLVERAVEAATKGLPVAAGAATAPGTGT